MEDAFNNVTNKTILKAVTNLDILKCIYLRLVSTTLKAKINRTSEQITNDKRIKEL